MSFEGLFKKAPKPKFFRVPPKKTNRTQQMLYKLRKLL